MPACSNCGGYVIWDFVRVFGIDVEVHGCPDCSTYRELQDRDGVEGAAAGEHRSLSFSTEERREKHTGDDQTDAGDEESDESADETDTIGFEYLERLSASIYDIAYLLERDQLDDRDVRVRADELPPPLQ